MQIAILHYHLNRGGVARVVENHLLALAAATAHPERVLVLHGGRQDDWPQQRLARRLPFPLQTFAVAGLDYDNFKGDNFKGDRLDDDTPAGDPGTGESIDSASGDSPGTNQKTGPDGNFPPAGDPVRRSPQMRAVALADRIVGILEHARFECGRTILHWHNHALGKNAAVPLAVAELARRGFRMLLQVHDFAEDLRPDNYQYLAAALTPGRTDRLAEVLYPQSPAIHYAVLNGRDRQLLRGAGVDAQRLHLLPNPVAGPTGSSTRPAGRTETSFWPLSGQALADQTQARRQLAGQLDMPSDAVWITYPVRGIRRKNLGEMLLWSAAVRAASSQPVWLHVTMTPQNPVELASFRRWQQLSEQLDLPCRFGPPAGGQTGYEQILAACDMLLTTSVAEGFGMVFLECWLAGRQLLGRDLPEITGDFRQAGIELEPLAPQLAIPTSWIDRNRLVRSLRQSYQTLLASYGQPPLAPTTEACPLATFVSGPTLDFARLPSQMQADVIRRAHHQAAARAQLRDLNRQLDLADRRLQGPQISHRIDANRQAIEQAYSLSCAGRQLFSLYTRLLKTAPITRLDTLPRGRALLDSLLRPDRLYPIRLEP